MTDHPDFEHARDYALDRLARELPPNLHYHSLAHTRDSVALAAERLAALSGVDGEGLLLLRTAAYYHDLGFVLLSIDHEAMSIQIAQETLPGFGYSPAQIEMICEMILATRLPQSPHTLLEQLLADADLDVLGREDFWLWNRALRAEMENTRGPISDEAWYAEQVQFLSAHHYWTSAARTLRDAGKQAYLDAIKRRLAHIRAQSREQSC